MNFAKHYNLKNQHAFLGASNYHWINYNEDKIAEMYYSQIAKEQGTRLHFLASELIELGVKLPDNGNTLNMYVNDAIGYKMNTEQILYYSNNCFGTADSICFRNNFLRIHDLKTGKIPAHFEQLEIYAALFCLEYDQKPAEIDMELRIYQNNDIFTLEPHADDIVPIMDKIITADKIISKIQIEEN